jgi:hypothetical protein
VWRERADFIINAALPEPGRFEQLWTRQVTADTFEICCIPFFLYDVALGDVVRTAERPGKRYILDRVVSRSGRYVFRVFMKRPEPRGEVASQLARMDGLLKWSSPSLLAVDTRDVDHAQTVADFLYERSRQGDLIYETGKQS